MQFFNDTKLITNRNDDNFSLKSRPSPRIKVQQHFQDQIESHDSDVQLRRFLSETNSRGTAEECQLLGVCECIRESFLLICILYAITEN